MTGPVLHSWSFHNYSLDTFLDYAQRRNWAAVELASCHLGDDPARAVRAAQQRGIRVETVGYFLDLTVPSTADRQRATKELIELVHLCADLDVPKLNGFTGWLQAAGRSGQDWLWHGSRLASAAQREWFVEAFTAIGSEAERRQIEVFVEVHPTTLHDTFTVTRDLVTAVGSAAVGITVDPANSVAQDARDGDASQLGKPDFPLYFHFKNYDRIGDSITFTVDADCGQLDLRSWVHALPAGVTVCIEYPGEGDPFPRLEASRRYYQEIVEDLAASAR